MRSRRRTIAWTFIAASALVCSACAQATPSGLAGEQSLQVSASNVDISTEIGAERLLRRIRDAALVDCARYAAADANASWRECMRTSMTQVVVQTHSPLLTARFARKGGSMIAASAWQPA